MVLRPCALMPGGRPGTFALTDATTSRGASNNTFVFPTTTRYPTEYIHVCYPVPGAQRLLHVAPAVFSVPRSLTPQVSPTAVAVDGDMPALKEPAKHSIAGRKQKSVRREYQMRQEYKNRMENLGSELKERWSLSMLFTNPPRPSDVKLELLMANQTHMGHSPMVWNPENSRYIVGVRQGIHIISLEQTALHLLRAARVVEEISYRGGTILFVGTRKGHSQVVSVAAGLAGACHTFDHWVPGLITNRAVLLRDNPVQVVDEHDQVIPGFEQYCGNPRALAPDLVICLNPVENKPLLQECEIANIPTIGIIDTDADPSLVTYVIPANDDSCVLGRAGQQGRRRRLEDAKRKIVPWKTKSHLEHVIASTKERLESIIATVDVKNLPPPGASMVKPINQTQMAHQALDEQQEAKLQQDGDAE